MTVEEAAAEIREHAAVRPRGGGTKLSWSPATEAVDFDTRRLNRIVEHNEGDFTAILEAGVPLAQAQTQFGRAGQMLALDPPLGAGDAATIGGIVATGDSGPLRHRYSGVRDLVVGMTVVLGDGTVAKSGGKVIKNVAGYDLAKLFAGSFGTLGLIARVAVRLHPAPERTATLTAESDDPGTLARAARRLAALPLEADALDVSWDGDAGMLVRCLEGVPDQGHAIRVDPHTRDDAGMAVEQRSRLTVAWGDAEKDRLIPLVDVPALSDVCRPGDRALTSSGKRGTRSPQIEPPVEPVARCFVEAIQEPDLLERKSCSFGDSFDFFDQIGSLGAAFR